jgi:hypothetical protein
MARHLAGLFLCGDTRALGRLVRIGQGRHDARSQEIGDPS